MNDDSTRRDDGALRKTWPDATFAWENSRFAANTFESAVHRVFASMNRQKQETLLDRVTDAEDDAYPRAV